MIFQRGRYTTNQMTFVDDQRLTPWFVLLRKHSEFEEHRLAASPGSAWAGCVIEVQPALNFEARVALMDDWGYHYFLMQHKREAPNRIP